MTIRVTFSLWSITSPTLPCWPGGSSQTALSCTGYRTQPVILLCYRTWGMFPKFRWIRWCLSWSLMAAVTKCHRCVAYVQQTFISHSSESRQVQQQGTSMFSFWEESASWFRESSHRVLKGRRDKGLLEAFCLRALVPFMETHDLLTSPSHQIQGESHGGLGFNIWTWRGGHRHSVHRNVLALEKQWTQARSPLISWSAFLCLLAF